ncbi:MAG: hypothetical protein Q9168_004916 [Polycauliona sp. 1 TL-2023]
MEPPTLDDVPFDSSNLSQISSPAPLPGSRDTSATAPPALLDAPNQALLPKAPAFDIEPDRNMIRSSPSDDSDIDHTVHSFYRRKDGIGLTGRRFCSRRPHDYRTPSPPTFSRLTSPGDPENRDLEPVTEQQGHEDLRPEPEKDINAGDSEDVVPDSGVPSATPGHGQHTFQQEPEANIEEYCLSTALEMGQSMGTVIPDAPKGVVPHTGPLSTPSRHDGLYLQLHPELNIQEGIEHQQDNATPNRLINALGSAEFVGALISDASEGEVPDSGPSGTTPSHSKHILQRYAEPNDKGHLGDQQRVAPDHPVDVSSTAQLMGTKDPDASEGAVPNSSPPSATPSHGQQNSQHHPELNAEEVIAHQESAAAGVQQSAAADRALNALGIAQLISVVESDVKANKQLENFDQEDNQNVQDLCLLTQLAVHSPRLMDLLTAFFKDQPIDTQGREQLRLFLDCATVHNRGENRYPMTDLFHEQLTGAGEELVRDFLQHAQVPEIVENQYPKWYSNLTMAHRHTIVFDLHLRPDGKTSRVQLEDAKVEYENLLLTQMRDEYISKPQHVANHLPQITATITNLVRNVIAYLVPGLRTSDIAPVTDLMVQQATQDIFVLDLFHAKAQEEHTPAYKLRAFRAYIKYAVQEIEEPGSKKEWFSEAITRDIVVVAKDHDMDAAPVNKGNGKGNWTWVNSTKPALGKRARGGEGSSSTQTQQKKKAAGTTNAASAKRGPKAKRAKRGRGKK